MLKTSTIVALICSLFTMAVAFRAVQVVPSDVADLYHTVYPGDEGRPESSLIFLMVLPALLLTSVITLIYDRVKRENFQDKMTIGSFVFAILWLSVITWISYHRSMVVLAYFR